jgi:hypothetical protein
MTIREIFWEIYWLVDRGYEALPYGYANEWRFFYSLGVGLLILAAGGAALWSVCKGVSFIQDLLPPRLGQIIDVIGQIVAVGFLLWLCAPKDPTVAFVLVGIVLAIIGFCLLLIGYLGMNLLPKEEGWIYLGGVAVAIIAHEPSLAIVVVVWALLRGLSQILWYKP